MIRIVLAEDHHVVRAAAGPMAEQRADIRVVGEVTEGTLGRWSLPDSWPDLLIMDTQMPSHRWWGHERPAVALPDLRILIPDRLRRPARIPGKLVECRYPRLRPEG